LLPDRVRHREFYEWADIMAGDFNYIRRHMPPGADAKMIVTNTATAEDVALLREGGLVTLITTTPELEWRSSGANVMEGVPMALAGKRPEQMQPEDYIDLLRRLGWQPRVVHLAEESTAGPA
jgi:hypothetical protein